MTRDIIRDTGANVVLQVFNDTEIIRKDLEVLNLITKVRNEVLLSFLYKIISKGKHLKHHSFLHTCCITR